MTRLLHRHRADEALIPCATTAPVARPRGVTPPRPHRPVGISRQVLNELLAAEAPGRFTVAGLVPGGERAIAPVPLHDPAELPLESELFSLIEWSTHVSASRDRACRALFAEDQERRERAAYDEWASDTDAELLTECSADIAAALAARPELAHDTALLMALAPVVAILKEVEL